MTAGVVTAAPEASAISVARQMRDHRVGSVVIVDPGGSPLAMITDRDLALRVFAAGIGGEAAVGEHASRPLICGEPAMELEEAAALMVQHRVRRLPVVDADRLAGIVTLDDIAVRTGRPRGGAEDDRRGDRGRAAAVLLPRARLRHEPAQGPARLGGTLGATGRAGRVCLGRSS